MIHMENASSDVGNASTTRDVKDRGHDVNMISAAAEERLIDGPKEDPRVKAALDLILRFSPRERLHEILKRIIETASSKSQVPGE